MDLSSDTILRIMATKSEASRRKKPSHRRARRLHRPWLLKTALVTVLVGGGAAYLIHRELALVARMQLTLLVLVLTVIIAGICLIAALAD